MSRSKVYFSFKFQALAPRALVFAPTTKYARISRAFAFDRANLIFFPPFPCYVGLAVRFLRRKMRESQQKSRKCAGQKYFLSEDLLLWDQIRRSNNRCLSTRENHSRGLRKHDMRYINLSKYVSFDVYGFSLTVT